MRRSCPGFSALNGRAGFSTLELLVTTSISMLLASVGIIAFAISSDSFNRANGLRQLEFDLRRAKNEAIAEGATGIFLVVVSGDGYTMGVDDLPLTAPPTIERTIFRGDLPSGVTISFNTPVYFSSRGVLVDQFGDPNSVDADMRFDAETYCTVTISPTLAMTFDCVGGGS